MNSKFSLLGGALLCCVAASAIYGDTLVFPSGDRLTGSVVSTKDGIVTFRHAVLGDINVPADGVKVELPATAADAKAAVEAQSAPAVDAKAAPAAEPAKPETAAEAAHKKNIFEDARDTFKSWIPKGVDGKISFGYSHLNTGDTSETLDLAFLINYKEGLNKYTFNAFYDYATSETKAGVRSTTADKYGAGFVYTRDLGEWWFAQSETRYDHDEILRINNQIQENLNVGYHVIKKDDLTWDVSGGPGLRYSDAYGLDEHWFFTLGAQEELNYKLNKTLSIKHLASFHADPADTGRHTWRVYVGLTAKITEWIDATLSYDYLVNNFVGSGEQTTEERIILAIGVPF